MTAHCLHSLHVNVVESTVGQQAREPHPTSTLMYQPQALNLTKQKGGRDQELGEEELVAIWSLRSVRLDFL